MKFPIITSIIGLIILLLLVGWVWAEEINRYDEITTMLQLPQVPYPNPVNQEQVESNLAYLTQNIRAILRENQIAIDRIKRVIAQEKQMARGE